MTGSAVPVLDVCSEKKIFIKGEGFGERGSQVHPGRRGSADFQVYKCVVFLVVFFVVLSERFRRSSGRFGCPFRVFRVPFRTHFVHF